MSAKNITRWIGIGLLGLPLYGALTLWSSLEGQPASCSFSERYSIQVPPLENTLQIAGKE